MLVSIAFHFFVGTFWYRNSQLVWPVIENSRISASLVSRQGDSVRAEGASGDAASQRIGSELPMQAAPPRASQSPADERTSFHDDYVPAERLTRQPILIGEIDFSATSLHEGAIEGEIDLLILIESSGLVSEVIAGIPGTEAAMYVEMLRDRFRKAKFLPGEIDGRAVRSALKIVVITERATRPSGAQVSVGH